MSLIVQGLRVTQNRRSASLLSRCLRARAWLFTKLERRRRLPISARGWNNPGDLPVATNSTLEELAKGEPTPSALNFALLLYPGLQQPWAAISKLLRSSRRRKDLCTFVQSARIDARRGYCIRCRRCKLMFANATRHSPRGISMPKKTDQRTPSGPADDLLQHAKQTTSNVVDQVQQQAGSRIDRRKDEAASEIEKVAGAVRQLGQGLGEQEQGPLVQYAAEYGRKAADGLERFTNYLRQTDTKTLVTELENFARRQPAIVVGGAFLLGLAGARFLKSSMPATPHQPTDLNRGMTPPPPPQPVQRQATPAAL